ncbi:TonB-dependent receptor [Litorimonas sp. RW-G-Af-16]|uniref:TonB-dependent receptor n=1 Tax=Litorimonas sp. RW-G-Af-16 TaxID=3241168 RepID=UPI00390C6281
MTSPSRLQSVLLTASAFAIASASTAFAQTADEPIDEIVATGEIQQSFEESLKVKRNTTVVSDALFGGEIGDLPDLSIAESLERITGVTSDRFKGGASELSIRGLGAFLGSSTLNGREITTGSDGRDVNFGQFPSELIGGTQVFKSQQADFVEGGISGIIELQTLRPLDYGKKRLQIQGLLGYSDYEDRVDDGQPYNGRITGSYVNQFDFGGGEIGISIGGQIRRDTAAEDIYTTSSTFSPCTAQRNGGNGSSDCARDFAGGFFAGDAPDGEIYFASNQYILRAVQTDADRDSIMGTIQWQPNDQWDINIDAQWSDRTDVENRHNLVFADGRRRIDPLQISPTGALLEWVGETRVENQTVFRQRDEEYIGMGASVEWQGEKLTVTGDVGYSETSRFQDELDMRIRTNSRFDFQATAVDRTVPAFTFLDPIDLNDYDIFTTNGERARRRLETNDEDLLAFRLDTDYELGDGFFTALHVGGRYADRNRINDDGIDTQVAGITDYTTAEVAAARRDVFPVADLFEGAEDGAGLGDNTWATWNPEQLFIALTGDRDAGLPTGSTLDVNDSNVNEETFAIYGMADFEGTALGLPMYGNVGVRAVKTNITSVGIQSDFITVTDNTNTTRFETVNLGEARSESNDFWNVLPSANLVFEVQEDMLLRFAAYRAIARPDVRDMSAAFQVADDNDGTALLGELIRPRGNPFLEPLESTNFDISYEWYISDDSAFSAAVYHKTLETGRENIPIETSVILDGTPTALSFSRPANSDEDSTLVGVELSVRHKFSELPGFLGGFGFQAGYNYAASDFQFPDPGQGRNSLPIAPFTQPANIPGYSKHSGNITGFWENDDFTLRVAYKGRSPYFKPFRNGQNRFTNSQEFVDASASYDINKNFQIRVQALNLTDEPNLFYRPTRDNLAGADYSGRRFFVGLRGRF